MALYQRLEVSSLPASREKRFELSEPPDREQPIGDPDSDTFLTVGESRRRSTACTALAFTLSEIGIPILKKFLVHLRPTYGAFGKRSRVPSTT
jgi:hypothetical protein